MGFFDRIVEGINEGYQEQEKKFEQEKKEREVWEKAHPNEDYTRHKILTRKAEPVKTKKLYQPGHKDRTGPAKHNALINLLGTSDLDEVIEGCAPHFTETVYGIRDKLNDEEQDYKAKYYELKGRYDELQKQNQELLQIVKNLGKQ